jgi:hypothetical protein
MEREPIFRGLVFDEEDNAVGTAMVGEEPCYVINDHGFLFHVPSEPIDRAVLQQMMGQIQGHEDVISEQTAKMLGQEDLFSHALIQNQLKHIDRQFEELIKTGIPEDGRAYMGMMGFKIIINVHGEVVELIQPGTTAPDDE